MTTTIKVDDALRDRLKAQAARHGLTLGGHLAVLADAEDRRERLAGPPPAEDPNPQYEVDTPHHKSHQGV